MTPRDANYTGPGSKFCILRPELVTAYCKVTTKFYLYIGFPFVALIENVIMQKIKAAEELNTGSGEGVKNQVPSESSQLSTGEGTEDKKSVTPDSSHVQVKCYFKYILD